VTAVTAIEAETRQVARTGSYGNVARFRSCQSGQVLWRPGLPAQGRDARPAR